MTFSGLMIVLAASATAIECPPTIHVKQEVLSAPSQWSALHAGTTSLPLKGAEMFAVEPNDNGAIQGTSSSSGSEYKTLWDLGQYSGVPVFVHCQYEGTNVILEQRIEDAKSCELVVISRGPNRGAEMVCK